MAAHCFGGLGQATVPWPESANVFFLNYKIPFQSVGRFFAGCENEL